MKKEKIEDLRINIAINKILHNKFKKFCKSQKPRKLVMRHAAEDALETFMNQKKK